MKNYTAYLFDMDGTLVNSEPLKALALSETCGCFGKKVKPGIYNDVMGESWTNVTNHFFTHAQIKPNIDDFNTEFRKIYEELIRKELKPNPNVKKLIEKLVAKNKKIGLVSSASIWMVKQILIQLQMSEIFDIVISHEDVNNHKPDPEAYILALKQLKLPGSEVLVFEDSNAGIIAAKKANCDVVAFRHEFNNNNDFSLAIKVISDFNEVLGSLL